MSSPTRRQLTRSQRRNLRHPKAAAAVRDRKASLPWQRARTAVLQLVDGGELPPGCGRVIEAMARCHEEHGAGVRDRELLIGYGLRGDRPRVEARRRARGEPPRFDGIADEAGVTRRYAIHCVMLMVAAGVLRRWFGGPNLDYRKNEHPGVLQRATAAGERRAHVQGIGGSGWANAYTVEGIPDPVPPDEPPHPPGPPTAQSPDRSVIDRARERLRAVREQLERDRVARQRRRLAEEEERRTSTGTSRGP